VVTATPENTFVGSVVIKKKERYNVYKVNKNFVWAGKHSSTAVIRAWEFKEKGVTFLNIMEEMGGKKLNFGNLMLDDENTENIIERKTVSKEKEKKGKYVNACCVKNLKKVFVKYHEHKNYRYPVDCSCGNLLYPLQGNEDDTLIFRNEYKQLILNYDTEEVTLYKDLAK
jgi:hypothetical protein